jgi:quercetin dioxygenase-like cupin family protein
MLKIARFVTPAAALALLLIAVSTAVATSPVGLSAEILAAAGMTEPTQVKVQLGNGFGAPRDVDTVVTGRFEVAPGGTFGWHRHPGPVIVSVVQGTLTVIEADACAEAQYGPGQGFIEAGHDAHTAINEGSTTVVLYATFLLPAGAGPLIDEPATDC